jgi:ABC-type multidrug transport system ATPase subunit/pSer/pThr/pTyr-binding forkhead associated (FHA) protein
METEKQSAPELVVVENGQQRAYPLGAEPVTIGRDPASTIVVADSKVSRRHAEVRLRDGGFELVDLDSRNGTRYRGEAIQRKALADEDAFEIGRGVKLVFRAGTPVAPTAPRTIDVRGGTSWTIGRDPGNLVALDHPQVSRFHARLDRRGSQLVLRDLHSTNGTFVNGARIGERVLREGDRVQLGPYSLTIAADQAAVSSGEMSIRVDAVALMRRVGRGATILQDVYLSIKPGEFVAIVGASGSGKSTLLGALSGFRPATDGQVLYNQCDLYQTFDSFRTSIGFVPQDDIIHADLSARRVLHYAALLRLPPDTTARERAARVDAVLAAIGLQHRRDTRVHQLSGGERKRISIGVELLTKPSAFFLDEPTSGLDPATERRMMLLLSELAKQGCTLVLVTHVTQNILLCDKVVCMARGGQLAFFGTPQEALDFFQVDEFIAIYDLLEQEGDEYARQYRQSPYRRQHLAGVLDSRPPPKPMDTKTPLPAPAPARVSPLHQYRVLARRYLELTFANRKALLILLAQPVIMALLISVIFDRQVFGDGPSGNAIRAMYILFLISIVAIYLGSSNAAKEIVKELSVYRRERMVTLQLLPYLGSKMTVLFGIALVQTGLLLAIVMAFIAFPPRGPGMLIGVAVATYLTFVAATMMGLFVSALVGSHDEAGPIVPILLVPQIIFAGAVFSLNEMGAPSRVIAQVMISKWSWETLGAIVDIPRIATRQGPWMAEAVLAPDKWARTFDISVLGHLVVLGLFCLAFLLGALVALKRKDSL